MNRDRILAALAVSTVPLNDGELSQRTAISPRQTVNRICRQLASEGRIARLPGPDGKLVNRMLTSTVGVAQTVVGRAPSEIGLPRPGSSHEQLAPEVVMLDTLGTSLGVVLRPRVLTHPSGAKVEVDGVDMDLRVLVECWAHQGPAKVAQKYKLMNDAIKLHWISRGLTPAQRRLIICVSDEAAVRHLRGRSWQGKAIADLGVELHVVDLPEHVVASIVSAQKRQYR